MIDAESVARALQVPCIISSDMTDKMQLWEDIYKNQSYWLKDSELKHRIKSMRLAAIVSRELKRLTLTEFQAKVNDTKLNEDFQKACRVLFRKLDSGIALGGLLLKPYFTIYGVRVDIITQNQYLPLNYTDDICDAIVCPEEITVGRTYYTRLEKHVYDRQNKTHTITNRCFKSSNPGTIGTECDLSEVEAWADILTEKVYHNVEKPLFAVFRMPDSNNIDETSSLGVSAFAEAVDFIHDADVHWERILWELESSERAIDASEDLFRFNTQTQKPDLPKGRERMYHTLERTGNDGNTIYNTFSPEVRDSSYFNALNQMLRRIECCVGLSYGTISEVADNPKTAEEIRSSKQRSFARVSDIQVNLECALQDLIYAMQYYHNYYNNSNISVELTCTFGDGVLENTGEEFVRRSQLVASGALKKEYLISWYFHCSLEEAKEMIPDEPNEPENIDFSMYGGDN